VLDGAPKLMFISAGNMPHEIGQNDYIYHEWNITRGGIEDPGQAWNALTIGAFTDKAAPRSPSLRGYTPVAEPGGLCPTSRTSLAWLAEARDDWPIKPDLVVEGGNYVRKDGPAMTCEDLSLLTTIMLPNQLLAITHDTSPATAEAARMAAALWSYYPKFRPETIRAMLVHSAKWTPTMLKRFPGCTKTKALALECLRCYGYGVPDLQRALHSAQNAVTMVYEGELQPFREEGGAIKTNHMHVHELPWPLEVLQELGDEEVTMRVTLSYFIEPSPNNVGWGVNHRYASHGLRFDVIRPLESPASFKRRISKAFWVDGKRPTDSVKETRNWTVGDDNRTLGSLHSDWWTGTAATLARCGKIIVYPVIGWWRERKHLGRYDQPARYSLVVSMKSRKRGIDLNTPITSMGVVQTEIVE
jgi:hypothetical protein